MLSTLIQVINSMYRVVSVQDATYSATMAADHIATSVSASALAIGEATVVKVNVIQ